MPNERERPDRGRNPSQTESERAREPHRHPDVNPGPTPGTAEGDRATVEEDLREREGR